MPDPRRASGFPCDVAVVGGCGQAGLPLAIAFADRGAHVAIYDVSEAAVTAVSRARMPWAGPGAAPMLERAVVTGRLTASADPRIVRSAEHVIVTMPERHPRPGPRPPSPGRGRHAAAVAPARALGGHAGALEPGTPAVTRAVSGCAGSFRHGQIIILRTVAGPGDTAQLEKIVTDLGLDVDVALCPEHIGDEQTVAGLFGVPQIVASRTERGLERARRLFATLTTVQLPMRPEEAELATLFAGAWHYPDRPGRRRSVRRSAGQHRSRAAAAR